MANMTSYILLCILYIQVVFFHDCKGTKTSYQENPQHTIADGSHIGVFKVSELEACTYLCSKNPFCGSFSYHGSNAECILSRKGLTKMSVGQSSSLDLAAYNKVSDYIRLEVDEFSLYSLSEDEQLSALVILLDILSLDHCVSECRNNSLCSGVEYTMASCHLFDQSATTEVDKDKGFGERSLYLRPMDQIARGKPAVQMSTLKSYTAAHVAVDGIYYDSDNEADTKKEEQPYWMVDLEKTCNVWSVKLFNNIEGLEDYPIWNVMVYVGESDSTALQTNTYPQYPRSHMLFHTVCDFRSGQLVNSTNTFICSDGPITGRYVFVEASKEDKLYLWLNEVEVRGIC